MALIKNPVFKSFLFFLKLINCLDLLIKETSLCESRRPFIETTTRQQVQSWLIHLPTTANLRLREHCGRGDRKTGNARDSGSLPDTVSPTNVRSYTVKSRQHHRPNVTRTRTTPIDMPAWTGKSMVLNPTQGTEGNWTLRMGDSLAQRRAHSRLSNPKWSALETCMPVTLYRLSRVYSHHSEWGKRPQFRKRARRRRWEGSEEGKGQGKDKIIITSKIKGTITALISTGQSQDALCATCVPNLLMPSLPAVTAV